MPGGRPQSPFDLPEEWQDEIMDLYNEGASDVEIKALIHNWRGTFSDDLWDRWLLDEPEFSGTIKKGRKLSESWWQQLGREGANAKRPINAVMWIFNMKNRFQWADRTKSEHSGEVKVTAVERTIVNPETSDS